MIGVILWRDVHDGKAVIWCEDQGDLAYLDRIDGLLDRDSFLDVGDVVRFDLMIKQNLRLARNVTRLLDNWGSTLGDVLKRLPGDPHSVATEGGAKLVPLHTAKPANTDFEEDQRSARMG